MTSTSSVADRVGRTRHSFRALVAGAALLTGASWVHAQAHGDPVRRLERERERWRAVRRVDHDEGEGGSVHDRGRTGLERARRHRRWPGHPARQRRNGQRDGRTPESAARSVQGMREVRNLLQVVPASAQVAVEASDEALAKAVSEALTRDAALADSAVSVLSVNKGVVLLSGSAKSLSDHVRALEDASQVDGREARRKPDREPGPVRGPRALARRRVRARPVRTIRGRGSVDHDRRQVPPARRELHAGLRHQRRHAARPA